MFSQVLICIDYRRFSGSGRASGCCWQSFMPFEVALYLHDYAGNLYVRRIQAMPACGHSCVVHDARHDVNGHLRVGTWIKRWTHRGGHGEIWQQDYAPLFDMRFLSRTEGR